MTAIKMVGTAGGYIAAVEECEVMAVMPENPMTRNTTAPSDASETPLTELRRVHSTVLSTDDWAAAQSKHYDIANAAAHVHGMIDASRC